MEVGTGLRSNPLDKMESPFFPKIGNNFRCCRWEQDHSMEVGKSFRSYLLDKMETPVFPKVGNNFRCCRWEQDLSTEVGTRSQHGGGNKPPFLSFLAAYNTREPSCIPHQNTFLKIGQVFKQAEGCQNGLKIHFVAYNPPVMDPNSLKIGRKNFFSLLTRSRLSHTF